MGETARSDYIQRRARAAREQHQARVMTPARAWRLAVGRAADDLFELGLAATSVEVSEAIQAQTLDLFSDDCLLLLLDGPEGRRGAVSLELPILAGLIEKQTMGVVLQRSADLRPPTSTDAALAAPMADAILSEFARNLSGEEGFEWTRGFRFGAMVEESRLLGLSLDADDFHIFRLQLDMEGGAKTGEMIVALPVPAPDPLPDVCDDPAEAGAEGPPPGCPRRLGQGALLVAETPLKAALYRMRMPYKRLAELAPGDVLTIPRTALAETRLETPGGERVVKCTLGQLGGLRAVRLASVAKAGGEGSGDVGSGPGPAALPAMGTPDLSETMAPSLDMPETGAGIGSMTDVLPDMPDLPGMDDAGALPDLDLDAAGGAPELPDMPDLPPMAGLGDLDDLPELSLDDLPELK